MRLRAPSIAMQRTEVDAARSAVEDLDVDARRRAGAPPAPGWPAPWSPRARIRCWCRRTRALSGSRSVLSTTTRSGERPPVESCRQRRVVLQDGVDPDQHGVVAVAEAMRDGAGCFGRDPLRLAARRGDPPVQRCGELGRDKRQSRGDVLHVELVEAQRVSALGSDSTMIPAARSASTPRPATFGFGSIMATTTRRGAAAMSAVDTRRRASVVRARLERDVYVSPACAISRRGERDDLRVRLPGHVRGIRWRSPRRPRATTHPTMGLGLVAKSADLAAARAASISASSALGDAVTLAPAPVAARGCRRGAGCGAPRGRRAAGRRPHRHHRRACRGR